MNIINLRFLSIIMVSMMFTLSVVGLAYAQVNIGNQTISSGVGILNPVADPTFNNNTGQVNASEIWITDEGNKDNVADIVINEIGDVDTTGVATGDFLQKSSGDWVDFDLFRTRNIWDVNQIFRNETNAITIGNGLFSTAYCILFHGFDENGTICWDNNGDEFEFDKNVNMINNKLLLGNAETFIQGIDSAQRDLTLSALQDIQFTINQDVPLKLDGNSLDVNDSVSIDFGAGVDFKISSDGSQGIVEGNAIYQTSSDNIGLFGTTPTNSRFINVDIDQASAQPSTYSIHSLLFLLLFL